MTNPDDKNEAKPPPPSGACCYNGVQYDIDEGICYGGKCYTCTAEGETKHWEITGDCGPAPDGSRCD